MNQRKWNEHDPSTWSEDAWETAPDTPTRPPQTPQHVVELTATNWNVDHGLACRESMVECRVTQLVRKLPPGAYTGRRFATASRGPDVPREITGSSRRIGHCWSTSDIATDQFHPDDVLVIQECTIPSDSRKVEAARRGEAGATSSAASSLESEGLLSLAEFAEALHRSARTLRRWEKEKIIPAAPLTLRDGSRWYTRSQVGVAASIAARMGILDRKQRKPSEPEQVLAYNRIGIAWQLLAESGPEMGPEARMDLIAKTVMNTDIRDDERMVFATVHRNLRPRPVTGLPANQSIEMQRRPSPYEGITPWSEDHSGVKRAKD